MTWLNPSLSEIDNLTGIEAFCFLVTEDDRPLAGAPGFLDFRMRGKLSRLLFDKQFLGRADERMLTTTAGAAHPFKLFFLGLGATALLSPMALQTSLEHALSMLEKAQVTSVALALSPLNVTTEMARESLCETVFARRFEGRCVVFDKES
jgi:Cytosol aminopeptidase family, N-terminal domain